jgi:AraC-like DNA-binding protein
MASKITWHSHGCFEILLVLEGFLEYEFEDGRIESLAGGQFLPIAPEVKHRGKHDVRRPARLIGLLFNPSAKNATRNSPFSTTELRWLTVQISLGAGHSHRMNKQMRGLVNSFSKTLENFDSTDIAKIVSMRLAICSILLDAARQCSTSAGDDKPQHLVQNAIQYMKSNVRSEVSIESVAKAVKCSRAKLFALFKESTGMTPNDYWLRLRIDQAQELLKSTELSVTRIAMDSGFSTSQYFSTVFKKYVGARPLEYRESVRG